MRPEGSPGHILVSDVDGRAGLAAARGLSKAGYIVTGASSARLPPGFWSRACTEHVRVGDPYDDPGAFVDDLASLLRSRPFAAVVPTTDVDLETISVHRELLPPRVAMGLPDREVLDHCLDKTSLVAVAEPFGLASPPGLVCEHGDVDRIVEAARQVGFPVVLKPRRSVAVIDGRLARRGARLARGEEDARALAPTLGASVLVQRFERGGILSVGGVVVPEGVLADVFARWHRKWPPLDGAASFCETVVPPAGLLERVEGTLRAMGHVGLFELELLERSDGTFAALDMNPRAFGWMTLAIRAGANLPAAWCDWLLGRAPSRVSARPGIRYRQEDAEVKHFLWQVRRGRLRQGAAVLRPRAGVAHAYFELRDPAPLSAALLKYAGRLAERAI